MSSDVQDKLVAEQLQRGVSENASHHRLSLDATSMLDKTRMLLENFCREHLSLTVACSQETPSLGGKNCSPSTTSSSIISDDLKTAGAAPCKKKVENDEFQNLREQIWRLFCPTKTDIQYLQSCEFRNKIRHAHAYCSLKPKKKRFHVKELIDCMILNKPKTEDQLETLRKNKARVVGNSSEKIIDKLKEKLDEVVRLIHKVEQEEELETDDDESAQDGVEVECNYVYLDRLKRRAVDIYNKIQELECNPVTTLSESQRSIVVRSTDYPEINRAASRMATRCARKNMTPDLTDVLKMVQKVNNEDNLGMSADRQRLTALCVFKDVCGQLRKNRRRELLFNMESLEIEFSSKDTEDPAENDPDLAARLEASKIEGQRKIDALFDKFSDLQGARAAGLGREGVATSPSHKTVHESDASPGRATNVVGLTSEPCQGPSRTDVTENDEENDDVCSDEESFCVDSTSDMTEIESDDDSSPAAFSRSQSTLNTRLEDPYSLPNDMRKTPESEHVILPSRANMPDSEIPVEEVVCGLNSNHEPKENVSNGNKELHVEAQAVRTVKSPSKFTGSESIVDLSGECSELVETTSPNKSFKRPRYASLLTLSTKSTIIELSDDEDICVLSDGEDRIKSNGYTTYTSGTSEQLCATAVAGRLRRLGTNVLPVLNNSPPGLRVQKRKALREIIEIMSDDD